MAEAQTAIKAVFKKAGKFKHLLSQSRCVVPISVGQEYHEGEKFMATMQLIDKHFKECVIMVADTLQRHTLQLKQGLTAEQAYALSLQNGDAWLERNKTALNQLTIPYQIMRWDSWLNHPDYLKMHKLVINLYEMDTTFRWAFLGAAYKFIERYEKRMTKMSNNQNILTISLKYIIEECIVVLTWYSKKYMFEVYPKPKPAAMLAIYDYFTKPRDPKLHHRIHLKFTHKHLSKRPENEQIFILT